MFQNLSLSGFESADNLVVAQIKQNLFKGNFTLCAQVPLHTIISISKSSIAV